MKKINLIILILISIILINIVHYNYLNKNNNINTLKKEILLSTHVSAHSAIVMNTSDNTVYFEQNAYQKKLPASITKILTCIVAIENYNLNDYVIVDEKINNIEGSKIYLKPGDIISIKDLLYGSMLCSGNDASTLLAKKYSGKEEDFIFLMNELCKKIGANSSIFNNPTGLDSINQNYTTAYDMALIMSYAMKNETFRKINQTISYSPTIYSNSKLYFFNKHKLIRNYEFVIGGKTGYTKKAGRTLVSVFKQNNLEIVIVTLDDNNDWNNHLNLARSVFKESELNNY